MGNQLGIPEEELFHPLGGEERSVGRPVAVQRRLAVPVLPPPVDEAAAAAAAEDSSECSFSSSSLPTLSASIMDDSFVAEEETDTENAVSGVQDGGYNFYYDEEQEDTVHSTSDDTTNINNSVTPPLQEAIDEPMNCYPGVLWKTQGRKRSRTHSSLFSSCTFAEDENDDDDGQDDDDDDDDDQRSNPSGCLISPDSLARSTSGLSFLARKSSAWSTTTTLTNDTTTPHHNADHEFDDDTAEDYNTTCTGLLPSHHYGQWSFSSQEESGFMRRASSELAYYSEEELTLTDGDEATFETDLRRSGRSYVVVTTACLPWMTGTAVNPLLRAAHLQRLPTSTTVTLVIPWLEQRDERRTLYGPQFDYFHQPSDQEEYIREWLRDKAQMPVEAKSLQLLFYPASYHSGLNSIFATGDICGLIDPQNVVADVCILEEPEHLNWFSGSAWTQKFQHVVGIVHTNYKAYASSHPGGLLTSPMIGVVSSLMVRAYCHKVIKLSAVLQSYAPEKEVVSNVHGIRSEFLTEGQRRATSLLQTSSSSSSSSSSGRAYFVGKLLWAKGLDRLLDLQDVYKKMTGQFFEIDIYGSGPEEAEIQRAFHGRGDKSRLSPNMSSSDNVEDDGAMAKTEYYYLPKSRHELFRRNPVPARFLGRKDHALLTNDYKVFVNPSVTEVLCTTTAEAIAMGKFAIIPRHRSNEFFEPFPNCLLYSTKEEFVAFVTLALSHEPKPLTPELAHQLTWEAATERCISAAAISKRDALRRDRVGKPRFEEQIAQIHSSLLSKGDDVIRKMLGGSSSYDPTNPTKESSTTSSSRPIQVTCEA